MPASIRRFQEQRAAGGPGAEALAQECLRQIDRDVACIATGIASSIRIEKAPNVTIGILQGLERFVPAEILAAVDNATQALCSAGHRLVRIDPADFDWTAVRRAALLLVEIEGARICAPWLDDRDSKLSPALRAALEFGRRAGAERIEQATRQVEQARVRILEWLDRVQLVVLPATPQTAFLFDTEVPSSQADLAVPASILGLPALSVPAPAAGDELPVGVQLIAARGEDALLLAVGSRLESIMPAVTPA